MGSLKIKSFVDPTTYRGKEYLEKSAEEIEKILKDLGLRDEDYSKDFTSTPGLHVYIYLDKADKNRYLHLYLNAEHFEINFNRSSYYYYYYY